MMTALHASWAVATPVLLVVVSAGQSRVTFAGTTRLGRVVSLRVSVWTQLLVFPQASVASQRRLMIIAPPQVLLTESVKVTVTGPQPSVAVATPVAVMLVSAGHSSVRLGG